jgi:hypothetical protein
MIEGSFGLEIGIMMRACVIQKVPSRRGGRRRCWSFSASWWIGGSVDRWVCARCSFGRTPSVDRVSGCGSITFFCVSRDQISVSDQRIKGFKGDRV